MEECNGCHGTCGFGTGVYPPGVSNPPVLTRLAPGIVLILVMVIWAGY
jgi:hypothetical protein